MKTGQKNTAAYCLEGYPRGKTTVESSVRVETVGDLAMAYSPRVAQPCLAIAKNPDDVSWLHTPLVSSHPLVVLTQSRNWGSQFNMGPRSTRLQP